ncbi:MAG: tRNA 2-thiouridine(34) synthase MnmA [Candidatus Paceibacterota bacterium]
MKKGNKKTEKVIIGLSGGVDSAVSAALLKKAGYEVTGATMKMWNKGYSKKAEKSACYGPGEKEDIKAAEKVAKILGIGHIVIDVSKEYEKYVLGYFREEYLAGRTPNPCVVCNQKIKFGYLVDKIIEAGIKFDYFATGHYARKIYDGEAKRFILLRGKDHKKDQSYFLYGLSQKQLGKALFPLGNFRKEDVRKMASGLKLKEFAEKEESQDFVEGKDYSKIIGKGGRKAGDMVDTNGNVLGKHEGFSGFTVGQRKGLKIGGLAEPYYVIDIDACKNRIIVGKKEDAFSRAFDINKTNWISIEKPENPVKAKVKVRSGAEAIGCTIIPKRGRFTVELSKPCFAVTKGQSAVFYKGSRVLGGGVIV